MALESIEEILKKGSVKIRVKRAGMFQLQTFTVKKVKLGNDYFYELYTDKVVELPELARVANEVGIGVEASNGRVFPEGKSAKDFIL
ncbi:MAG: hypothetical protein QXN59_01680 [Candidatus Micrarchaeaceae archaeon]